MGLVSSYLRWIDAKRAAGYNRKKLVEGLQPGYYLNIREPPIFTFTVSFGHKKFWAAVEATNLRQPATRKLLETGYRHQILKYIMKTSTTVKARMNERGEKLRDILDNNWLIRGEGIEGLFKGKDILLSSLSAEVF